MKKRILLTAVICGISAVLAAVCFLYQHPQWRKFFPPCPFFKLSGLYCPGCGSTRATYYLLHGDIAGVFRSNVMYLPAFIFLLVLLIFPEKVTTRWYWICFIVVILYWILRNLPWYPFTLLAPLPLQ